MNAFGFTRFGVAWGLLIGVAWALSASDAGAQTRREVRRYGVPVVTEPVPVPVPLPQPIPAPAPQPAPPPQPASAPQENAVAPAPAPAGATQVQGGQTGRLIRGNELIGRPVWGLNRERLGIVKDFIIDEEGSCPTLFFAMAPEISGWNGDYVIVPFDAFQVSFDERQSTNFVFLGVTLDNLRRAPHLAVDRWGSLRDRQFVSGAKEFYQRIERTAARPHTGGVPEGRKPGEGIGQPSNKQPGALASPRGEPPSGSKPDAQPAPAPPRSEPSSGTKPETQPPSGTKHGTEPQPGAKPQPQPAPPARVPETAPPKSNSHPSNE